jgi:hypothetical protein
MHAKARSPRPADHPPAHALAEARRSCCCGPATAGGSLMRAGHQPRGAARPPSTRRPTPAPSAHTFAAAGLAAGRVHAPQQLALEAQLTTQAAASGGGGPGAAAPAVPPAPQAQQTAAAVVLLGARPGVHPPHLPPRALSAPPAACRAAAIPNSPGLAGVRSQRRSSCSRHCREQPASTPPPPCQPSACSACTVDAVACFSFLCVLRVLCRVRPVRRVCEPQQIGRPNRRRKTHRVATALTLSAAGTARLHSPPPRDGADDGPGCVLDRKERRHGAPLCLAFVRAAAHAP